MSEDESGSTDTSADEDGDPETSGASEGETGETEGDTGEPGICDAHARRYAPPPIETAEGQLLEAMDLLSLRARLSINERAAQTSALATLRFQTGPQGGWPLFELRQEIVSAHLDGEPLAREQIRTVMVSEGAQLEHLALAESLAPCSEHELVLALDLEGEGLEYGALGVRWGAEFTDLEFHGYLGRWLPSGLLFDQFALELEFGVLEPAMPAFEYGLLTSGEFERVGPRQLIARWDAVAPYDPLWELRRKDAYTAHSELHMTPTGQEVPVEFWVDEWDGQALSGIADALASLDAYTLEYGSYPHDRLVGLLTSGGMEYGGGFVGRGTFVIDHEVHHMWWGRGIGPARVGDGWIDEGWSIFVGQDYQGQLLDWDQDGPRELFTQDPYAGLTIDDAYYIGAGVFQRIAHIAGLDPLREAMAALYAEQAHARLGTPELERYLYCALDEQEGVREVFWRWVYGNPDEPPPVEADWCG